MAYKFLGILNKKYKKINSKVRFVGIRFLPLNLLVNSVVLVSKSYGLMSASEIEAVRRSVKKFFKK